MTKTLLYCLMLMTVTNLLAGASVSADEGKDATTKETEEINTGQDKTKPLARFDIRYRYHNLASDNDQHTLILRADKPFVLNSDFRTILTVILT